WHYLNRYKGFVYLFSPTETEPLLFQS
ncbi:uncharacterized protein METZ01_LOCUS339607, partial [marine metagenome]